MAMVSAKNSPIKRAWLAPSTGIGDSTSQAGLGWEYAALRDEILKRMETRSKLIELALLGSGVVLVAGAQASVLIPLLYPTLILLLAASWRHNERGMRCISDYMVDFEEAHATLGLHWETHIMGTDANKRYYTFKLLSHTESAIFLLIQTLAIALAVAKTGFAFRGGEWALLGLSLVAVLITLDVVTNDDTPWCIKCARYDWVGRRGEWCNRRYLSFAAIALIVVALGAVAVTRFVSSAMGVRLCMGDAMKAAAMSCAPSQTTETSIPSSDWRHVRLVFWGQGGDPSAETLATVYVSEKTDDGSYVVLGRQQRNVPLGVSVVAINLSDVFKNLGIQRQDGITYSVEIDRDSMALGSATFRVAGALSPRSRPRSA
jgi:hypothetical protein